MDVSPIITRLQAECPAFAQILEAQTGGTQAPVASQAALVTLLGSTVGGRMYPLQLPENPATPHIVYQMVSSLPGSFEGYDVTHTDLFVLNIRDEDYDNLLTLVGDVVTALDGENIEITDVLHDYDQRENLYRVNLEISYSYITAADQSLPVAFVYPVSRDGQPSAYDNLTKQKVDGEYAVLVVTDGGDLSTLLDEIQAALLGWQQSSEHHEMEYGNGSAIEGVGGLEVWRELYRDAFYMTQT